KDVQDNTIERGDIIVTDETAKALSQPKPDAPAKGTRQSAKAAPKAEPQQAPAASAAESPATPAPVTVAPLPAPTPAAPATESPPTAEPKRGIRTVGPPFIVR